MHVGESVRADGFAKTRMGRQAYLPIRAAIRLAGAERDRSSSSNAA
jgi:hypothetical protein